MYSLGRSGSRRAVNIWPGFVDGLATLLMVVIFVLMVFMMAQFFLSVALTSKDAALDRLHSEINELAELLSLERRANADLRINVAELSSQLQSSLSDQERLSNQLLALDQERDDLTGQLRSANQARDSLAAQLQAMMADRDNLNEKLAALISDRDDLAARLQAMGAQRDDLQSRLDSAETVSAEKAKQLAAAEAAIDETNAALNRALAAMAINKERLEEALATIAANKEELAAAYQTIEVDKEKIEAQLAELAILQSLRDEMLDKLSETEEALGEEKELSKEANAALALLNRQIVALRQQLARLAVALEAAEAENTEKEVQIADLGKRLNVALASKVQELARYRSEFFGRLREALGDRQGIRIVGDRFVFQSEVLFRSGSAELGGVGKQQIAQLAGTLIEIAGTIPDELDWVLRVDGHTDRAPISTALFPSNWELSTARAISVVKFLVAEGIPPTRLAATGFGEFQPLDPGNDEIAFRRNRRIEFKLTQK